MRGAPVMAGLVTALGAALVAVATGLRGTLVGNVLLGVLSVAAAWPLGFFLWAGLVSLGCARARERATIRMEQEIDRGQRRGDRVVLVLLRFPDIRPVDFPFFPTHRGALDALRNHFRSYDQVERVGFATYAIVLPGTEEVDVLAVRERLLEAVRRKHRWSVRVGVSVHPEDGLTPEILFDHADRHCA